MTMLEKQKTNRKIVSYGNIDDKRPLKYSGTLIGQYVSAAGVR